VEETVHKLKWFWAWQDEKEEAWLRTMSQRGYHLVSVRPFGSYSFNPGDSTDYVYRLDYQINKKDMRNYLQLFHDAGWEHIGEMSGWQYFRKEAMPGESPEIHTDVESKVAKYKRLMAYVGLIDILMIVVFSSRILQHYPYPWWNAVQVVFGVVVLLLTYGTIRLALRIRQLRRLF
jgi:hypothetical protein